MGTMKPIASMNQVFEMANNYKAPVGRSNGVSTYMIADRSYRAQHDKPERIKGNNNNRKSYANRSDKKQEMVCYGCGKTGHMKRDCPAKEEKRIIDPKKVYATCVSVLKAESSQKIDNLTSSDIMIDTLSEVNLINSSMLINIRECEPVYVKGVGGHAVKLDRIGEFPDIGECLVSDDLDVNILSFAMMRDKAIVAYNHEVDEVVAHVRDSTIHFRRVGNFYIADMSEWSRIQTYDTYLSSKDNAAGLTNTDMKRAVLAREFLANAGYPSERQAVEMVTTGNILNLSITAKDVRNAYRIWGKDTAYVRGKARRVAPSKTMGADLEQRDVETMQHLTLDVMKVGGINFLMGLSKPLNLMLSIKLDSMTTNAMLDATNAHLSSLNAKGFVVKKITVDPQSSLVAMRDRIPGVTVDVVGAGDHLPAIDVRIKMVKETIRSVNSNAQWNVPKSLIPDIVQYSVSRANVRGGTDTQPLVCPRVSFTGRKISATKELDLGFGDYVECYDPQVKSNDALANRTEPCIALHPAANEAESWTFFNVSTGRKVRRSTWIKMVTTPLIVSAMNAIALREQGGINGDDLIEIDGPISTGVDVDAPKAATHVVPEVDKNEVHEENSVDEVREETVENNVVEVPEENEANDVEEVQEVEEPAEQAEDTSALEADTGVEEQHYTGPIRQSARIIARKKHGVKYAFHTMSVKRGIYEHGADALAATMAELRQLLVAKKAFHPIDKSTLNSSQLEKVIRSQLFLKVKYDALGNYVKIKGRLVANGKQQDRDLYPDASSPTAALQSLMMVLAVAANKGQKAAVVDIGGAYLNADMTGEEVFMDLDPALTKFVI